mmetsp:Transcript_20517/g.51014  ORF Transcript_20517/g.51014 Transcript_20517/m.51014 type:complete len:210 (-) Transcript_20517:32-661(-)
MVTLGCGDQTINPWQELFGAVIGVKNNGDTVLFGHSSCVEGTTDGSSDSCPVIGVVKPFASIKLGTTRRKLNDNRSVIGPSGFEAGVDARTGNAVNGRNGVAVVFGVLQQINHSFSTEDTGVNSFRKVWEAFQGAFVFARNTDVTAHTSIHEGRGSSSRTWGEGARGSGRSKENRKRELHRVLLIFVIFSRRMEINIVLHNCGCYEDMC